ncbi:response regulator [uncultured Desulfobacter sp.]|uniref:response regulator transcription factor n=1 Tax=Desulfobacter postgatei TaxID=2293 RepID=UPI00338F136D
MSGLETYKRIKKIQPSQKAILASGHSESEDVLKALSIGAGAFVKKPYTIFGYGDCHKKGT